MRTKLQQPALQQPTIINSRLAFVPCETIDYSDLLSDSEAKFIIAEQLVEARKPLRVSLCELPNVRAAIAQLNTIQKARLR